MTSQSREILPYGRQFIGDDDIAAVSSALKAAMLTTGPLVERFEAELASMTGASDAVVCNSGTSALYLIAKALNLTDGSVAIVPSQTFLATATAPRLTGAEIVFSDVDPDTGLMRPADLERALEQARTEFPETTVRAAFVVHLNGQSADMPALRAIAERHHIYLVEDACHAIGGLTRRSDEPETGNLDSRVGDCRWSDAATFSFHPVKSIAMGEGGAVTVNDPEIARRLRLFRNHGMERSLDPFAEPTDTDEASLSSDPWIYGLREPSLNFRAPDILCALGISQLAKLPSFIERRRQLFELYTHLLSGMRPEILEPATVSWGQAAWHLCALRIRFDQLGIDRAMLMQRLESHNIRTQVHYIPVHHQPYWVSRYGRKHLPGADTYYSRTLSVPLYYGLADSDVEHVVDCLRAV